MGAHRARAHRGSDFPARGGSLRERLRRFLRDNLPPGRAGIGALDESERLAFGHRWRELVSREGLLAVAWPREYGGAGLGPLPGDEHGLSLIGPTILQAGTERQKQFFIPKIAGAVLRLDVDSGAERRWDIGRRVGCVVLREEGDGLLLGLQEGFGALDTDTGGVTILSHVGHDIARMQLNDGACDPAGRFFAGSIARDAARGLGVLYRY